MSVAEITSNNNLNPPFFDYISTQPDDVLVEIFSRVNWKQCLDLRGVSKQWKKICDTLLKKAFLTRYFPNNLLTENLENDFKAAFLQHTIFYRLLNNQVVSEQVFQNIPVPNRRLSLKIFDDKLYSATQSGRIEIFNLKSGMKEEKNLQTSQYRVLHMEISREKNLLFSSGLDGVVKVFHLQTHALVDKLQDKIDITEINEMHINDADEMFILKNRGRLKVWDKTKCQFESVEVPRAGIFLCFIFGPIENTLIFGCHDGDICYWNYKTHEMIHAEISQTKGNIISLHLLNQNYLIATEYMVAEQKSLLKIIDIRDWSCLCVRDYTPFNVVIMAENGKLLLMNREEKILTIQNFQ